MKAKRGDGSIDKISEENMPVYPGVNIEIYLRADSVCFGECQKAKYVYRREIYNIRSIKQAWLTIELYSYIESPESLFCLARAAEEAKCNRGI